tara:strand:+ start:129 stop:1367 length:1239 start_codon:yes stop_codon:yes gene_type:complete
MAEKNATAEVKQEGEFSLKGKKTKPKKLVDSSKQDPVKVDLTKPEAQGELVEDITKVDLTEKKEEDAVQAQETNDSNAAIEEPKDSGDSKEVVEKVRDTKEELESPIQEITEEELDEKTMELYEEAEEAVKEQVKQGKPLPENIQSLVDFMNETGGTIEDYVRLNHDYSKVDDQVLIREYYKNTKPHLDQEEISFLIEDQFKYDEEIDEPRDIKKKKLAFKEEIAKARKELDVMKDKYYQEIKLRPGASQEQQKAMDFFNRYKQQEEQSVTLQEDFKNKTEQIFTDDFKGFDFNLGEKKFRYKVQNPSEVGKSQLDVNNFISKFVDDKGAVTNATGYHKALYAAMNADKIANHFYEQGRADGIKNVVDSSKNLSTDKPRQVADGNVFINGLKVKSISGLDSSKLKIKKRKFN